MFESDLHALAVGAFIGLILLPVIIWFEDTFL
jgi:hypothetical protein